jgi:hypothetical protein
MAREPDPDAARQRILDTFMNAGRIVQIPRQNAKRRVLLDLLAQEFEPGVRYTEREVNDILARFHRDTAAWRRYLVDEEFMERDSSSGMYWRAGGSVDLP